MPKGVVAVAPENDLHCLPQAWEWGISYQSETILTAALPVFLLLRHYAMPTTATASASALRRSGPGVESRGLRSALFSKGADPQDRQLPMLTRSVTVS